MIFKFNCHSQIQIQLSLVLVEMLEIPVKFNSISQKYINDHQRVFETEYIQDKEMKITTPMSPDVLIHF